MADTAKDMLDKISGLGSGTDPESQRNKATANGAAVGGIFGMYYGWSRKKNILVWGMFGALGGAIIARILMPK